MPVPSTNDTIEVLVASGLPLQDVQATIPDWWEPAAESSRGARLELLFMFARKFHISAGALLRGQVRPLS